VSRFFRQPSAAHSAKPAELKFETKEKEKKVFPTPYQQRRQVRRRTERKKQQFKKIIKFKNNNMEKKIM